MEEFRGSRGQVTVFLSIVLMGVIMLVCVLVDCSRIAAADVQVRRAVQSAANSALASYNYELKDEYGIFALDENCENRLRDLVIRYISKNLMIDTIEDDESPLEKIYHYIKNNIMPETKYEGTQLLKLYHYRIEDITVSPVYNLSENPVVRDQILEYMKFRAPIEITEGIIERFKSAAEAGKMAEAYKKKSIVDELLGGMSRLQQNLKRSIDGRVGHEELSRFYINGFNINGKRDVMVEKYANLAASLKQAEEELDEIDNDIDQLEEEAKREENSQKAKELGDKLDKKESDRSRISRKINDIRKELDSVGDELYYDETVAFDRPNKEAEQNILGIIEVGRNAESAIKELEYYLDENFKEPSEVLTDFIKTCKDDIEKLRKIILDGERAQQILDTVAKNSENLASAMDVVRNLREAVESSNGPGMEKERIIELLNEVNGLYNNALEYIYAEPGENAHKDDPRKGMAEMVKGALAKVRGEDIDMGNSGIDIEKLPSRHKVESRDFTEEDMEFINHTAYAGNPVNGLDTHETEFEGNLREMDKEVDFSEGGKFSSNAFSFISSMGKILEEKVIEMADEIYINEYIMGSFKNSVPVLKSDGAKTPVLDLRGQLMDVRNTFFKSEVEYILHGSSSENINKTMTEAQILLIRFGLNTLHVYTDSQKREIADSLATTVAGWWTGGAGIPIISNLIMCAWGMGEAIKDVSDLLAGEKVPFYKQKGDWKLDLGILTDKGAKSSSALAFTYHDYLRLLLFLKKPHQKMDRIEDLIQLNMSKSSEQFSMTGSNTCIRIEVIASVNYLFMTETFIPKRLKTADGRHKFKVLIYAEY